MGAAADLQTRLSNMTDREILIETRVIQQNLCKKVDEVKSSVTNHENRLQELEKHDVAHDAVKNSNKDTTATVVAIAALVISLVATAANIFA